MPILIGLAFREAQVFWGTVLLTLLVGLGLSVRWEGTRPGEALQQGLGSLGVAALSYVHLVAEKLWTVLMS